MRITRRHLLGGGLALGATGLLIPRALKAEMEGPRFLVTVGCFGGASMLDCYMPVDTSEALTGPRGTVISYATEQVGNIRSVSRDVPVDFLERFGHDAVVLGTSSSSVNHFVAQARSINGRDVFQGRTLGEAVAAVHGTDMALPNINMGRGGYTQPGSDPTLDPRYLAEIVTNPVTWPLSTHGSAGILHLGDAAAQDPALQSQLVDAARALRDEHLESASPFSQTFPTSRVRRELLMARQGSDRRLEADELIQRLLYVPDLGELFPLSEYGLSPSEEADRIQSVLPGSFPATTQGTARDRLQAQAALAYLLIKTGASASVTLTEPGTDGFLAFDQSHGGHRNAQSTHWDRVLDTVGRLITLLQGSDYLGPGAVAGETLWDRTLVVFATEFGRDKWDVGGGFGTGHHLNNGLLAVSPLLRGDQSLGEPDPNNGFICGFDGASGEPTPFDDVEPGQDPLFSDPRSPPAEEAVFGTLAHALGVTYVGQETLPVLLSSG
jgi:hypothetical protein